MIVLVVNFEVKAKSKEAFMEVMNHLIEGSHKEEGNMAYDLYADLEKPNHFVLLEKWKDQAALDFHKTTDHFTSHIDEVGKLCNKMVVNHFVPIG